MFFSSVWTDEEHFTSDIKALHEEIRDIQISMKVIFKRKSSSFAEFPVGIEFQCGKVIRSQSILPVDGLEIEKTFICTYINQAI